MLVFLRVRVLFMGVILLELCRPGNNLKCYQCSTEEKFGCYPNELKSDFLKECPVRDGVQPVCRSLAQVHLFTADPEMLIIRECAYVYNNPLGCERAHFHSSHYSMSCECDKDGCNKASTQQVNFSLVSMCLISWIWSFFSNTFKPKVYENTFKPKVYESAKCRI